jgi:protein arginine N-methyltransferase 1
MTDVKIYDIAGYGQMIADKQRMDAYLDALRSVVRPGCVVVDIGAGTGIFTLAACKLGASRVYAIEPGDSIEVARDSVHANGFDAQVVFVRGLSTDLELVDRKADVVVADIRGVLPFFQGNIAALSDARKRLLAPGGALIPSRDVVWIAPVDAPHLYECYDKPWLDRPLGLDISAGRRFAVNSWRKVRITPDELAAAPQRFAEIDYHTVESPHAHADLSWTADSPHSCHGLLMWFDATLWAEAGFSNAPGAGESIYGQAFFPLERPLELRAGQQLRAQVSARLVAGDYVWTWQADTSVDSGREAGTRQSTFFSNPLGPEQVAECRPGYAPQPTRSMQIDRAALSMIDGRTTAQEIAARLHREFPDELDEAQARERIVELLRRHPAHVRHRY